METTCCLLRDLNNKSHVQRLLIASLCGACSHHKVVSISVQSTGAPSEATSMCFCRNIDALPVELDSVYIIRVSFDSVLC